MPIFKRNKLLYEQTSSEFTSDGEGAYTSFFRKFDASFHADVHTEAISLLGKGCQPFAYTTEQYNKQCALYKNNKMVARGKGIEEFYKLNKMISDVNYINDLNKKMYNIEYQNVRKPIAENVRDKTQGSRDRNIHKKFEILKKKYANLKKNIDIKVDLGLIKAGAFYNKGDIRDIFLYVKNQQNELDTKSAIIQVQTNIIGKALDTNKMNKKKIGVTKQRCQKLTQMCKSYYKQSEQTQLKLEKIKYVFIEYKLALENIISYCENLGGDKIILMDGIKSARAQSDLYSATHLLDVKKMKELQNNIKQCEEQITNLKIDLNNKIKNINSLAIEKKKFTREILHYNEEINKSNNLLNNVLTNFQSIVTNIDTCVKHNKSASELFSTISNNIEKHNEFVKKIISSNDKIKGVDTKLLLQQSIKEKEKELNKHNAYSNTQLKEIEKQQDNTKVQEENEQDRIEAAKNIIETLVSLVEEKNKEVFTFNECVDVIYKSNIALTQDNINELKKKEEISKDELITFVKSIVMNEDQALQLMISFFEIWDVQKTGRMHKDLIMSILNQFGDEFTEEETDFLQTELNELDTDNVSYVDLLKKWMN